MIRWLREQANDGERIYEWKDMRDSNIYNLPKIFWKILDSQLFQTGKYTHNFFKLVSLRKLAELRIEEILLCDIWSSVVNNGIFEGNSVRPRLLKKNLLGAHLTTAHFHFLKNFRINDNWPAVDDRTMTGALNWTPMINDTFVGLCGHITFRTWKPNFKGGYGKQP